MVFFGCSSKENTYPPITEDFCAQISHSSPRRLTDELAPLAEQADLQTGVYTLEEGDVSMTYKAWLSESAEESSRN